jgi:hypothetical protein
VTLLIKISDTVSKDEFSASIARIDDTLHALRGALEQILLNQNDALRPFANQSAPIQQSVIQGAIERSLANQNGARAHNANERAYKRGMNDRVNQNECEGQRERHAMSECGDEREPTRKRTVSNSERTARAFVSIRAHEAFKAGQDVRAWLQRLDQ